MVNWLFKIKNLEFPISVITVTNFQIRKLSTYYEAKDSAEDDDEADDSNSKALNIFDSLPHVLRQILSELTSLFADLKTTVSFDQNILVTQLNTQSHENADQTSSNDLDEAPLGLENHSIRLKEMCHDANNKFMSFLLINSLILDTFSTDDLDFKVRLVSNLREINFNDNLMNCIFRLMPSFKHSSVTYFTEAYLNEVTSQLDSTTDESFQNRFVQMYACRVYKQALKSVPAMIRDWWNIQQKRVADQVDKYTIKYVSIVLLEEEIREINRSASLINLASPKAEPIMVEVNSSAAQGPAKKTIVIEDDETSTIKIRGKWKNLFFLNRKKRLNVFTHIEKIFKLDLIKKYLNHIEPNQRKKSKFIYILGIK